MEKNRKRAGNIKISYFLLHGYKCQKGENPLVKENLKTDLSHFFSYGQVRLILPHLFQFSTPIPNPPNSMILYGGIAMELPISSEQYA